MKSNLIFQEYLQEIVDIATVKDLIQKDIKFSILIKYRYL